jgi:hypothetical protein
MRLGFLYGLAAGAEEEVDDKPADLLVWLVLDEDRGLLAGDLLLEFLDNCWLLLFEGEDLAGLLWGPLELVDLSDFLALAVRASQSSV